MDFDSMRDVPTNEEEVMIALQRSDELLTSTLQGLYRAFRGQGKSLMVAYQLTLEAHVRAAGYTVLDSEG